MKFSIGYNHDSKLFELIEKYKQHIEALYFPMPSRSIGSGRCIIQNQNYSKQVPGLITRCKALAVKSQLLLNSTCEGAQAIDKNYCASLMDYIQQLKTMGLGSVVVTNPLYIQEIKRRIKGLIVESSVNCYVKTVEHALYLRDMGVDIITVDRDINHNIPLIKEIKNRTGLRVRIMLNEGCLKDCPYRNLHYNVIAHSGSHYLDTASSFFADKFCISIYKKNPAKVFTIPFIAPEDLKRYRSFCDCYKLTTRVFSTAQIKLCLEAYIRQEYKGDLLDILDSSGLAYFDFIDYGALKQQDFFKTLSRCKHQCDGCDYCGRLFKKAVILNPAFLNEAEKVAESKKAVVAYTRMLKTPAHTNSLYLKLAQAYAYCGEHEKAIAAAEKAVAVEGKEVKAYLFLAQLYESGHEFQKTLNTYREAAWLFPESGPVYVNMARTHFNLKDYTKAIALAHKALQYGGKLDYTKVFILLGLCYRQLLQFAKAKTQFKKAEKINPQDTQINFFIYECYKAMGLDSKANKEFSKIAAKSKQFNLTQTNAAAISDFEGSLSVS